MFEVGVPNHRRHG